MRGNARNGVFNRSANPTARILIDGLTKASEADGALIPLLVGGQNAALAQSLFAQIFDRSGAATKEAAN
jgi:hypothetical protein